MKNIQFKVSCISDKGQVKEKNEDAFVCSVRKTGKFDSGVFAVADGVGGLYGGEIASSIAAEKIERWWDENFTIIKENIFPIISELFHQINKDICLLSKKSATTLSVLLIKEHRFYIVHIGDSRIYRFDKRLEMLTIDHSIMMNKRVDGKTVRKTFLTECLGNKMQINCFKAEGIIKEDDIFLLCSDGICKRVHDKLIQKIVKKNRRNMDKVCKGLLDEALKKGETDNITVIAVKILNE